MDTNGADDENNGRIMNANGWRMNTMDGRCVQRTDNNEYNRFYFLNKMDRGFTQRPRIIIQRMDGEYNGWMMDIYIYVYNGRILIFNTPEWLMHTTDG